VVANLGNPAFNGNIQDAFRFAVNPPARVQVAPVFPDLVLEVAGGVVDPVTGLPLHPGCPQRPCPQAIDVQDPGMMVVNYRNEPVGLRIYDPNKIGPDGKPGMQADGDAGDLAFALASRGDRAIPEMNTQPNANTVINGTRFPPQINTGTTGGDPYTPMLRAFTGDLVRLKMQSGGHEEEHNATIHGLKWLQGGSAHGKAGNSGWRAAHAGGISEQFTLTIPPVPVAGGRGGFDDYAYSMDASHDGWWTGMWGVLRAYNSRRGDLYMLPNSVSPLRIANARDFNGPCPVAAPVRTFDITAVLANTALPDNPNVGVAGAIVDPSPVANGLPTDHVGNVALDPNGGSLVYNARNFTPNGGVALGAIHDPTAALFFHSSDMVAIDPNDPNCITGTGRRARVDPNLPGCPVRLADGKPIEPVVIRAAAGECIELTLRNKLPALQAAVDFTTGQPIIDPVTLQPVALNSSMPDLANYTTLLGVVKRDRFGLQGSTTFQPNLIRTSGHIGLHPQLVTYDISRHNGMRVGNTADQTIAPGQVMQSIRWYAGDLTATVAANGREFTLTAKPLELGGANIQSADPIKQGAKSMVGALVIEPQDAQWDEETDDAIGRQSATVTKADGTTFRDFSLVLSKALTQYWADGTPVPHMNGEGFGIPEDSQEATGMAMNYGIDPAWHRLGIMPNAEFGAAGAPVDTFGAQAAQFDVFSNAKVGGDPETPVFTANADQQVRMRVTNPYGTSRGSTFTIHGHLWQRDPYVCAGSKDGIDGRCGTSDVGSQQIGDNKQAFYQSAQESINPSTHFDIVLPRAGGPGTNGGDYMFRDYASFGSASGLWGILRVNGAPAP
jgi:hypothetical protein